MKCRKSPFVSLCCLFCAVLSLFAVEPAGVHVIAASDQHALDIKAMATDAQGKYLLTASTDKTAKIWEIASGKLVSTFRPAVGNTPPFGYSIYGSLSPDGLTGAVSGLTEKEWRDGYNVHIFETATGKLLHRMKNLPRVSGLAFSPDGKSLAIALSGGESACSVRLVRLNGEIIKNNLFPGKNNLYLDWHASGKMLVTSSEAQIQLCEIGEDGVMVALATGALASRNTAMNPRFSPDGSKFVLCGFWGVDVYDTQSLFSITHWDPPEHSWGHFLYASWAQNGSYLYMGGVSDSFRRGIVRRVPGGRISDGDTLADILLPDDCITAMAALPDGRIACGGSRGGWAVLASDQRWEREMNSACVNFDRSPGLLSANATTNAIIYPISSGQKRGFSLPTMQLLNVDDVPQSVLANFAPAKVQGIPVTNWADNVGNRGRPLVNGKPLQFSGYSRCFCVASDNSFFLIGSLYKIDCFKPDGTLIWSHLIPSGCTDVILSRDKRMIVATFQDGTIRWFSGDPKKPADKRELLIFRPHADGKRWVIHTPEGYYDASPDGHDLIGIRKSVSADLEPTFIAMSKLRETYHRPGLIQCVFSIADRDKALDARTLLR